MGLKEYDVEINGYKTTLQLSDEDAKLQGLKPADEVKPAAAKAKTPANKAKAPAANKQAPAGEASKGDA